MDTDKNRFLQYLSFQGFVNLQFPDRCYAHYTTVASLRRSLFLANGNQADFLPLWQSCSLDHNSFGILSI